MSAAWKTVRVFISSTFRDMHAERDHLVKVVFPASRERLEKHRIHLVDIDLRWGIIDSVLRVYVGRENVQERLTAFADGDAIHPCLVTGPSGSGKSAAMAKFATSYSQRHPEVLVVPHFVGASPGPTSRIAI